MDTLVIKTEVILNIEKKKQTQKFSLKDELFTNLPTLNIKLLLFLVVLVFVLFFSLANRLYRNVNIASVC